MLRAQGGRRRIGLIALASAAALLLPRALERAGELRSSTQAPRPSASSSGSPGTGQHRAPNPPAAPHVTSTPIPASSPRHLPSHAASRLGDATKREARIARLRSRTRGDDRLLASLRAAGMLVTSFPGSEIAGQEHIPYRLHKRGLPVLNAGGQLHRGEGVEIRHTGRLQIPPLASDPATIDEQTALALARASVPGRGERALPRIERGWLARERETVPAWRLELSMARPLGSWQVSVDARTGAILERNNLLRTITGMGLSYEENAVSTPSPVELPLYELDGSGFLRGRVTQVFDVRETEAFRADSSFFFGESDSRFVQTSVYRGLTDGARYAEAHGFPPMAERVLAFANLFGGPNDEEFNNAFYDPFFPIFGFGNGDGVVTANLGTDYDVAIHELGHHIFQELVDPMRSSSLFALGSINEAFADSLAALVTGDPEIGESTLPGQPYLRTVANDARWPEDASPIPHAESAIFSGLTWDIAKVIGAPEMTQILIAGLPYLETDPDFRAHAYLDALLFGDHVVSQGANRNFIIATAANRGIAADLNIDGFLREQIEIPISLGDGEFRAYFFAEFPGSRQLTATLRGNGDADLLLAPVSIFNPNDPTTYMLFGVAGSNEQLTVTRFTVPSIDEDDFWLVAVEDFPNGQPSEVAVVVSSILPSPGISIGGEADGRIGEGGEVDLLTFQGQAGQIVRLEATALEEGVDLAVSIFDSVEVEIFGADDDSGGDSNPLIQGAQLPRTQLYAIAVFSLVADVDPRIGTGDYRLALSLCVNEGPDADSDGLADACDDDDDNDDFIDSTDLQPFDPLSCQDIEGDGCDDCVSGAFDPFDDGANQDGDHLCDAGDPDDDNDGCADEIDDWPLAPSPDPDFDFVGEDCDNCPDDYNPGQIDEDRDGVGSVCDPTPTPEPGAGLAALTLLLTLAGLRRWRRR